MKHKLVKLCPVHVKDHIKIDSIYTFYYYEHSKNFAYEGEQHDFWEMVYVDSGVVLAKTDTACHILTQGNVIFHKPMEFHALEATNNKPHNIIVFTFSCSSPEMSFFEDKIFSVTGRQKRILAHFTEEMIDCFGKDFELENRAVIAENNFGSMQAGIAHFEIFLLELIREHSGESAPAKAYSPTKNTAGVFTHAVKEYLEEMVEYPLTLNHICDRFNVSKSYLCRIFKEETGHSVMDYYINLKIGRAKVLIREGNLNLTQIAEKLGYSGIHHFSRIFKERENMSPGSYAKSVK